MYNRINRLEKRYLSNGPNWKWDLWIWGHNMVSDQKTKLYPRTVDEARRRETIDSWLLYGRSMDFFRIAVKKMFRSWLMAIFDVHCCVHRVYEYVEGIAASLMEDGWCSDVGMMHDLSKVLHTIWGMCLCRWLQICLYRIRKWYLYCMAFRIVRCCNSWRFLWKNNLIAWICVMK